MPEKSKKANIKYFSLLFVVGFFLFPKSAYLFSLTAPEIIHLTNIERSNHGLPILQENKLLDSAARKKAEDILRTQKFQHNIDAKKFSDWVKESNYTYSYVGENLAIDFSDSTDVIDAWMKSKLHKKNLLNEDFRDIGVAAIDGEFEGRKTVVIVQLFGTVQEAEASAEEYLAAKQNQTQEILGEATLADPLNRNLTETKNNYNFITIGFLVILLGELWVVLPRRSRIHKLSNTHKI